jgi:hypothetical protein
MVFLWLFPTLVHGELVQQILLRACVVAPKVGWSKELVLAFGTTSHSANFAVVSQDDEAALWHDEDSVAHSQERRARLCRMTRARKGSGCCHRAVIRHIQEFGIVAAMPNAA